MVPFKYNLRSLMVRKTTTAATALGIALVVFVFSSVLMLSEGIKRTLNRSGRADTAIILSKATDSELGSTIFEKDVGKVLGLAGVAKDAQGNPIGQAEMVVVVTLEKTGGVANVSMRGIPDKGLEFRSEVKIVSGRAAKPGTREVIVGRANTGRFKGLGLGQSFELIEGQPFQVVGVFSARGSALESEIWGDLGIMRQVFGRPGMASSVHARLMTPGSLSTLKAAFDADSNLEYEVTRQTDFYEKQSQGMSMFIMGLGITIAVFFSIGAMIGAMITMYASIANRQREIGTLRALGFGRFGIMVSFLGESIVLAAVGGALGALASLGMKFVKFSTMNFGSWSEVVFSFEPTSGIIIGSVIFATVMGLFGGLLPAIRAARMSPIEAMRG